MKIISRIAGVVVLSSLLLFPSCNRSTTTVYLGNWVHVGDFQGVPRGGAFNFTIGETTYVGLGYSGTTGVSTAPHYVDDCWSLNNGIWTKIASFPGPLRERAVAFAINGKGYIGTGYNRDLSLTDVQMKDFWEYDPATDQWTQLNDFGGAARYNAVGFANATNGFVGTGYDGTYYGDFWRYDPADDSWTAITPYSGTKRQSATVMEINQKFYLMGGINNNSYIADAWEFDPAAPALQAWVNITPLTTDPQYANFKIAVQRYDAVGFSLGAQGYIATGISGGALQTVYQYDPALLTWTKMTNFERAPRSKAFAAVIGGRIFLGTGINGGSYFDDVEEFLPLADYDLND